MKLIAYIVKLMRFALKVFQRLKRYIPGKKVVYVTDRVIQYRQIWENAAQRLDASISDMSEDIWEIEKGARKVRVNHYRVPLDDPVVLGIAGEKDLCYRLLSQIGIRIPEYEVFSLDELDKGISFFKKVSKPVVVKPAAGTSGGRGVTSMVSTYRDLLVAISRASLYGKRIIIEKMIAGELYRLLFLDAKMVNAVRRTGIRVTGDGHKSIAQLLKNKRNQLPGLAEQDAERSIIKDKDIQFTLSSQGLNTKSIAAAGEPVLVRSCTFNVENKPEINAIYTEDVTEMICEQIIDEAEKAIKHVNIRFAGVDMIAVDPRSPLSVDNGAIIEINSTPGLHHHYNVDGPSGKEQAAEIVLNHLFKVKSGFLN